MSAEPVLANLQGYPVLVKTPEGSFIQVRGGAAVAGPGFERYAENRTLTRVAADFGGIIVYTTPESVLGAPAPVAAPEPAPREVPLPAATGGETIEVDSTEEYAAVLTALGGDPGAEPAEPAEDASAEPAASTAGRKVSLTVQTIQSMTKRELAAAASALGLADDGSRSQLVARLSPYVGQDVELKR